MTNKMPSVIIKEKVEKLTDFLKVVDMLKKNGLNAQIFRILVDTHQFQPEGLRSKDIEKYMEGIRQQDIARSIGELRDRGLITTTVSPFSKRERHHSISPRVFEVMVGLNTDQFQFQ